MTSTTNGKPLGSARTGSHHWWGQRLSALALVPLSIWFVASLVRMPFLNYDVLLMWLSSTFNVSALLIMMVAILYHAALGMQVVYEDYIRGEALKLVCILATKFIFIFLGVIAVLSVAKIYFLLG
jgi:succinate dehydrogenase / fumarate reductase, membrane anchor subunit